MKRMIGLLGVFVCAECVAATPTMTFPYGADMTVRYQASAPVQVKGLYAVPSVQGGMPSSDTVSTFFVEAEDIDVAPAETWSELSASASAGQAALALRAAADGGAAWVGLTDNGWVELSGVPALAGSWSLRIDCDYTLGADNRKVRYSVKTKNATEYVVLTPTTGGSAWLPNAKAGVSRVLNCKLSGSGFVASAVAESGQRQCYAETAIVEDFRMDYSGVTLDVAVGETWGVDTLVATVKDEDGKVKGEVRKSLSDAQDGKVRLDLSAYTKSGESSVYDLKLTGEYNDTPMTCEKGESQVDLFSMVDWFGFDGTAPVKASVQDLTISVGVLSSTDPSVKGLLIPNASETESSPTAVEMTLSVPGSVPYWDLPALPVAESQGALVMVQFGGSVGRSWAVWSATANDWVAVSGTGVGTGNGSYEVRAEFDEISSVRSVRYSVKVGSDYVVL